MLKIQNLVGNSFIVFRMYVIIEIALNAAFTFLASALLRSHKMFERRRVGLPCQSDALFALIKPSGSMCLTQC